MSVFKIGARVFYSRVEVWIIACVFPVVVDIIKVLCKDTRRVFEKRVFPYARWLDIYGRYVVSAVLLVSRKGEYHTLMLHLCLWRRQTYIDYARCWVRSENSFLFICSFCKFHVPFLGDDLHLSIIFVVGAQYYVEISPKESTRVLGMFCTF